MDFVSGLTVALILIPQSMAYARLADLPAYYGLYAAFLPPIIAALFGSSHQLATGPVAIVSLMTATALAPLATAGSEAFIAYAVLLALLVGVFQFLLGALRLGLIVNFLSHPVVNGFTNAAALIIATSQLASLLGVDAPKGEHQYETVYNVLKAAFHYSHLPTLGLATLAFAIMITLRRINRTLPNVLAAVLVTTFISWATDFEKVQRADITQIGDEVVINDIGAFNRTLTELSQASSERVMLNQQLRMSAEKNGAHSYETLNLKHQVAFAELAISELRELLKHEQIKLRGYEFIGDPGADGAQQFLLCNNQATFTQCTGPRWKLRVGNATLPETELVFMSGGAVVGNIPQGLPSIAVPHLDFEAILSLLPMAIIISILGFMEAISIAKAMAARTRARLDPSQELIGQGLANIVGSFAGSYPVSGSFSRSAVNLQAGAVTGMSSVFSSIVVLITLLFFTPLLYHLPLSVLAAIIMMAVIGLVNVKGFVHAWQAQRHDGVVAVVTFITTLVFAPHLDRGIMLGVALSLGHYLYRNIKPDMALLSKYVDGTYRSAERRKLELCKHLAVVRFNNSLFFANVNYLEEKILELVARMPELKHIHIVGNGINELDASGEETLSLLVIRLRDAGYDVTLSGLNELVLEVMERTHLMETIGEDHLYGNVALAVRALYDRTHRNTDEKVCPLLEVRMISGSGVTEARGL